MIAKIRLGSAENIRAAQNIANSVPFDADIQSGDFVADAKTISGKLNAPMGRHGILNFHTNDRAICEKLTEDMKKSGILIEKIRSSKKYAFSACAVGEMLIDFTMQGRNSQGQRVFAQNAGGAPANVMAAMAKLGARTAFIGKAGSDMHGRFLKETLETCKINNDGFTLTNKYFTTLAFVDVKENGDREFAFARNHGADKFLEEADIPLDIINGSGILHVGSVSLTDEPERSAAFFAAAKAKESGATVSYDPNYRADLWHDGTSAAKMMRKMMRYADVIKISDEETNIMTGTNDLDRAGDILISSGIKIAVITLGKRGAYVRTSDGSVTVPGFRNKALDATGAGDSFWGGFLYQLSRSEKKPADVTLDEAAFFADFGNAVASLCVEKHGAIPAMPEMADVEIKMKESRGGCL